MAVKKISVPFCDWCGLPFLPKFKLKDGTPNPIFDHPEKSKRCGKCKRTGWNAGGIDRRRKNPAVSTVEAKLDIDLKFPNPRSQTMIENLPAPASRARRCRHGLFKCDKCRPVAA